MDLVDVDVFDSQGAQAGVDALAQPPPTRIAHQARVRHPQPTLRRDDDGVATRVELAVEGLAEQALGGSEAVPLGGVEHIDPELARPVDRADRTLFIERAPFASE